MEWDWRGRTIKMFDTAGMRRKAKVTEKLEKLSVADGLRAIRFAETVVIVFDATIPFEKQDLQIVDLVLREGRAAVLAFNKWDLVEDAQAYLADLREKTERLLPQARGIRAVPISGQTGYGLDKLMQSIIDTDRVWNKRISTARLNRWLDSATTQHPPPAASGRRVKLKYMTQVKARPPAFMISCTRPDALPESYIRYLTNGLRSDFDMRACRSASTSRRARTPSKAASATAEFRWNSSAGAAGDSAASAAFRRAPPRHCPETVRWPTATNRSPPVPSQRLAKRPVP